MISLIIGKSDTGKSKLAESLALKTGDDRRYYIATMKVMDDAGRERVIKHRKMREGKDFITIERQKDIVDAVLECDRIERSTILLECVSNLVSNEIFDDPSFDMDKCDNDLYVESMSEKVAEDIRALSLFTCNLIIVTNEYDADGPGYDDSTRLYVKVLSRTNMRIKEFSDEVYDLLNN